MADEDRPLGRYLTTNQVANIFQVTPYTVRVWIDQGDFEGCIQIGRYWRIPEEAVKKFAQQRHGQPTEGETQ